MRRRQAWLAAAALAACTASAAAQAATYRCVDANGRVTLSDLPCPVPPPPPVAPLPPLQCTLTAEQRRSAERLETQFLHRYPNEQSHRDAAVLDLQEIVARLKLSRSRLADLVKARKAIDDEIEFYRGRTLPPPLKARLDESEAKFAATADVFRGDENDIRILLARFDCEHRQFDAVWHGGAPGSSGCVEACR